MTEVDRSLAKLEANLKQIEALQITVTSLQATVNAQSAKLADLEDGSRRNNPVIFGLPENPTETDVEDKKGVL